MIINTMTLVLMHSLRCRTTVSLNQNHLIVNRHCAVVLHHLMVIMNFSSNIDFIPQEYSITRKEGLKSQFGRM